MNDPIDSLQRLLRLARQKRVSLQGKVAHGLPVLNSFAVHTNSHEEKVYGFVASIVSDQMARTEPRNAPRAESLRPVLVTIFCLWNGGAVMAQSVLTDQESTGTSVNHSLKSDSIPGLRNALLLSPGISRSLPRTTGTPQINVTSPGLPYWHVRRTDNWLDTDYHTDPRLFEMMLGADKASKPIAP